MLRIKFFAPLLIAAAALVSNEAVARNIARDENRGVRVIVLDPGHGGRFPGAHYGNVKEKDLTLAVALKLGKLIRTGMPGVEVVYTRTRDEHLDEDLVKDLKARAAKANDAGGDLFLSIHVNAARSTSVRGVETLIMGETPKEQQNNEEALIATNRAEVIEMVDDEEGTAAMKRAYIQNMQFSYGQYSMAFARCIQDSYKKTGRTVRKIKPQVLRVLYSTAMPCALTEIGFMSNPEERAYLTSEKGQTEIARALYDAVKLYADRIEAIRRAEEQIGEAPEPHTDAAFRPNPLPGSDTAVSAAQQSTEPAAKPARSGKVHYAVQLFAGAKKLPQNSSEFKVYKGKAKRYASGNGSLYKYCVGEFRTREEAKKKLKEVQRHFPEAFIVCCRGNTVVVENKK